MRITPFLTASALAVAVGLAACSGASQTLPGGSQSFAPAAHNGLHLVVVGAQHDQACPSSDFVCTKVSAKTGGSVGICVSSTGSCSGSLAPYTWTGAFFTKKGKKAKNFKSSFDPNPGNPVTITITEKKKIKPSKGLYKWYEAITACSASSSCISGNIGIATTK